MDRSSGAGIIRNVRAAVSVALLMVSASGVNAQRRGAFIAGPPYTGRPVVPAVTGTPGAVPWNPGSAGSPGNAWQDRRRVHNRDGGTDVIAVPFPVAVGPDQPDAIESDPNQAPPEMAPQPDTFVPPVPAAPPSTPPPSPVEAPALSNAPAQPTPPEPPYVLIALRDGWVYAAIAYWVDRDTLHYVTLEGDHNQVSLQLVDRAMSARLNRASQIDFRLP